jgi:hypothetical protein
VRWCEQVRQHRVFHEDVQVTPDGLVYRNQTFGNIDDVCNYYKVRTCRRGWNLPDSDEATDFLVQGA